MKRLILTVRHMSGVARNRPRAINKKFEYHSFQRLRTKSHLVESLGGRRGEGAKEVKEKRMEEGGSAGEKGRKEPRRD